MARNASFCKCFSLCTPVEAVEFLRAIPGVVTSESSPWVGYLAVAYGKPPRLPVNLSGFNFFYANDARWPSNVEWPMPSCHVRMQRCYNCLETKCSGSVCATTPRVPNCPAAQCQRWLAPDARPTPAGYRPGASPIGLVHLPSSHRCAPHTRVCATSGASTLTRGTAIFGIRSRLAVRREARAAPGGQASILRDAALLGHAPPRAWDWQEVVRMDDRHHTVSGRGSVEGRSGCTPPTPLPTSRHPPLRGIPPECTCRAAAQTAAGFIRSAAAASG